MIPFDFQKYLRSKDFKVLLSRFQQHLINGDGGFFDSDELLDIAEYYHLKDDLGSARKAVEYCLELYPGNTKALVFLARTFVMSGDVDKAQLMLDEIHDDNSVDVKYLRAELLICRNDIDAANSYLQQQYDALQSATSDLFSEVEEEDAEEDYANYPLDVCLLFCDYQVWDKAEWWLACVTDPELVSNGDYIEAKARILTAQGKYKEAIATWNSYIDIDAYSTLAWIQLSQCHFHEGNCAEALQCAEYAESIDPNLSETYISEANYLFSMGKSGEAVEKINKYMELCPDDIQGELFISSVLFSMGKYEEADQHITKACNALTDYDEDDSFPNAVRIDILRQAAYICSAQGRMDDAMLFVDKTLFYGMSEEQHLLLCAGIYLEHGDVKIAFEKFSQALAASNHDPGTYIIVANMVIDAGLYEQGYNLLSQILDVLGESGVDNGVGYDRYAYAAFMTGHYREFLDALEVCTVKSPSETATIFSSYFPEGMPVSDYLQYAREHHIDAGASADNNVTQ